MYQVAFKKLAVFSLIILILSTSGCLLDEESGTKVKKLSPDTVPTVTFFGFLTTRLPALYSFGLDSANLTIQLGSQEYNIGQDANMKLYGYGFDTPTDITFRSSIVEDSRGVKGVRIGYYESNSRDRASAAKFQVLAKDVTGNIYLTETAGFDVYTVGASASKEVAPLPLFLNEVEVGESWNSPATLIPYLKDEVSGWMATLIDDNATAPTSGEEGCILIRYESLNSAFYWYLKPGIGLVEWVESWENINGKVHPITGYAIRTSGGTGVGPYYSGYGVLDENSEEVILSRKGGIGHIIKKGEAAYTSGTINGREFPAGTFVPANLYWDSQPERDSNVYQFFNLLDVNQHGGFGGNVGSRTNIEQLRFPFDVFDMEGSDVAAVGTIDFRTAYPDLPSGLDPLLRIKWKGRDDVERTYIADRNNGNVSVKIVSPIDQRFGASEALIRGTVVEEGNISNTRRVNLSVFLAYDHSVAEISQNPDPIYTYQPNVSRVIFYAADVFGHLNQPYIVGKGVRLYFANDAMPFPYGLPISKHNVVIKETESDPWRNPDISDHSCWGAYDPECDSAEQVILFSDSQLVPTNDITGPSILEVAILSQNLDGSAKVLSYSPWFTFDVIDNRGGENKPPKARIRSTFKKEISGKLDENGEFIFNVFYDGSADEDGYINKYSHKLYKVGDDGIRTETQSIEDVFPSGSLTLTENGNYILQLTVTDDNGAQDITERKIIVSDRALLTLDMRDPHARDNGVISKYFKVFISRAGQDTVEYEFNSLLDFGEGLEMEVEAGVEYDVKIICCGPTVFNFGKEYLSENGEGITLASGENYLLVFSDVKGQMDSIGLSEKEASSEKFMGSFWNR